MIQSNKRKVSFLAFIAACIFISVAATKPGTSVKITPQKQSLTDTGRFKNLKVLPKNITEDSLMHLMHSYNAALGVRCNFCHAFNNGKPEFASDEKPEKDIARYMITMTAGINKTYFNSENSTMPDTLNTVQCVTCHHGNPHPDESAMAVGNNNSMPPPPPGANGNMPPPMHDTSGKKMPPPPDQR